MNPSKILVLAAFLLGCCMPAHAQVNVTVRSSGTITFGATLPGMAPIPAGTAYTMEMSSDFPTTASWISWPNFLNEGDVPFTIQLTLNGTTQTINAVGQMNLGMAQVGSDLHLVNYTLSMRAPGTLADRLSFTSLFYLDTQGESMILIDLFDAAHRFPVDPTATNVNFIRYGYPDFSSLVVQGNAHTVAYFTAGSPIAVIPEPSSAAMLLAGFGLVGAIARRRRG